MEIIEKPVSDIQPPVSTPDPKYRTIGDYKRHLSEHLDAKVFEPNPYRLVGYGACAIGSLGAFFAIVLMPMAWPFKLGLGLLLGFCNGTLAFMSHEVAHGSIVKNTKLQDLLVLFGAQPFFISPTFWRFWHNKLHHGKTQQLIRDPDAFPNHRIFKTSRFSQFMFPFTPGSGHKRSALYFFFWFSFHNFVAQIYLRFRNNIFNTLDHRRVNLEFGFQILIGIAAMIYAGPSNWLWVFLVPLAVQNYLLMSYIATNHNLSPLTPQNDPLINSLTVQNPSWIEALNLNFGYHVEHHIFPSVSGKHLKTIHYRLKSLYPDTYQVMPKWEAIKALYSTPRIYKNANTFIHPETKEVVEVVAK